MELGYTGDTSYERQPKGTIANTEILCCVAQQLCLYLSKEI